MPKYRVTFTSQVEADTEDEAIQLADDGKGPGHWQAVPVDQAWFNLAGWQQVDCAVADLLRASGQLQIGRSMVDPDGHNGPPVVFSEWWATGDDLAQGESPGPVLRDYRWTDDRPCEHYVPVPQDNTE